MDLTGVFLVFIFVNLLPEDYTVELSVNSSITDKCPGDVISVLCSTTNNEIKWVWQSTGLTDYFIYSVDRFSDDLLNVPHNFSKIQSVTTTLLNYSRQPLYLNSSLQYIVSSEYAEVIIECNDFMTSPSESIQVTTNNCSLGSQDFNLLQNDSSLSLCLNRLSDQNYNYTVHIYTQNASTSQFRYNNESMEITLQYGIDYCMNVTSECCGSPVTIDNFNFQLKTPNSHPHEIYNISVKLYFDCIFPNEFIYPYTQKMCVTSNNNSQPDNNGTFNFTDATSDPNSNMNTDISNITTATNNYEEESVDTSILIIPIVLSSFTFGIAIIILCIILTTIFIRKRSGKNIRIKKEVQATLDYDEFQFPSSVKSSKPSNRRVYNELNHSSIKTQFTSPYLEGVEYGTLDHQALQKNEVVIEEYEHISIRRPKDTVKKNVDYAVLSGKTAGLYDTKTETNVISGKCQKKSLGYDLKETDINLTDQSLNLDSLLINLQHLAPKWQEIGIHLKVSAVDLKSIQEHCKEVDSDCLVELFDKWLRSTDTPTWKNITDALDAMEEQEPSQNIVDILSEGMLCEEWETDIDAPPIPPQKC